MSENFAELFEESLKSVDMIPGSIVTGVVIDIDKDWVTVHAGLKSEGVIPAIQFADEKGEVTLDIGDEVQVSLETVEDGFGETRLSREKAKRAESWKVLETAHTAEEIITGIITGKVKGGFTVDIAGIRAFLPGSLVDLRPVRDTAHLEGKPLEFKVTWKRIKHPSEIVEVGDEIEVKVLKFDRERNRVSLGLKQMGEDPWVEIKARYPEGARAKAVVTNLTDYGCFAEIQEGVEGLVHVSEMDWTNKNIHPSKVVQLGDEVEVMILEIDEERRRISLGIKQCQENPWDAFAGQYEKGDKISGNIKSITDFGIFIGLNGGIDGLVHLSDIAWDVEGEEAVRDYKKGDELETVILAIDPERERISLGVKQLTEDDFSSFAESNDKGAIVKGTVKEVDAKAAIITLADGVEGVLKAADISREKVADATTALKVGDEVEAVVMSTDRKNRTLSLSIKAKDAAEEKAAVKEHSSKTAEETSPATLGDLIKAQMAGQDK